MNPLKLTVLLGWAVALLSGVVTPAPAAAAAAGESKCYEMRIYYAPPGRLDDLHARFRNHTMKLFEKHGIENVGYWVPADNSENKLIYLLGYPSREAREASWKAFMADPDWKAVQKQTEANGRIVAKVEAFYLTPTDYSPAIKIGNVAKGGVFELRTYTTPEGRLSHLDSRFRDHTIKLFEKHGMGNWGYFHRMADQPEAATTLVYLLTHKSQEAAKASFGAFGQDPAWKSAREASEKAAGGSLTAKDGVKSVFLVPTDYSPTK
ncbi:MAG TPA: NIPSNAP family protein [Verrucomicrobiales bacterium]|nr:NIPSNAP family protein [Verrucomicrobiales bacterium]